MPTLTRRHFIALAEIVKRINDRGDMISHADAIELCEHISDMCEGFNPAFDRERFKTACGL